jgi:two-component system sensor histidine kinase HydH
MKRSHQYAIVAVLSVVPTLAHYVTDAHNGPAHDIYQRFYYLPIILAGLWFGARGGFATAILIAIAYFPHAIHGWTGPYSVFYRFMEVGMYLVVGWLTGWLSDRLRVANESERQARTEAEIAFANLKKKTDELFALEEQLRRTDRLAALGKLSAGLAHEIRNPLASIKTSVEILGARSSPEGRQSDEPDFAAIILEETARLDSILSEFLQFARAEQSRPAGEPHFTRVADTARAVFDLTEMKRKSSGVRVALGDEVQLELPVAICSSHLHQVFLNLLLNSIDAMPNGGEFRILLSEVDQAALTISVEDTGTGIAPGVSERIFDPFYSTKDQGTGLGLSIVERILDSHGGSIALAPNEANTGTRFMIKLPLAE